MHRRQFLIGSGAILTSNFIEKADWFLREKSSVVPLVDEKVTDEVLYFVNTGYDYELRLDTIDFDFPTLTLREALELYHGISLPNDRPLKLSEYRELYYEHGVLPSALDKEADWDWVIDAWARKDSCNARAYHRLEPLDLFDYGDCNGRLIGGLDFIDGYHPGNDYLGVRANDALSASLLQARLLELDENVRVELVENEI